MFLTENFLFVLINNIYIYIYIYIVVNIVVIVIAIVLVIDVVIIILTITVIITFLYYYNMQLVGTEIWFSSLAISVFVLVGQRIHRDSNCQVISFY